MWSARCKNIYYLAFHRKKLANLWKTIPHRNEKLVNYENSQNIDEFHKHNIEKKASDIKKKIPLQEA